MAKKFLTERTINILVPVLSVVFGLLVGAIVMLVSGYDPIVGYAALWEGMVGNPQAIGETLRTMIPLVLAGLSVAFAFRTGLFQYWGGRTVISWVARCCLVWICSVVTSNFAYSVIYFSGGNCRRFMGLYTWIFKRET